MQKIVTYLSIATFLTCFYVPIMPMRRSSNSKTGSKILADASLTSPLHKKTNTKCRVPRRFYSSKPNWKKAFTPRFVHGATSYFLAKSTNPKAFDTFTKKYDRPSEDITKIVHSEAQKMGLNSPVEVFLDPNGYSAGELCKTSIIFVDPNDPKNIPAIRHEANHLKNNAITTKAITDFTVPVITTGIVSAAGYKLGIDPTTFEGITAYIGTIAGFNDITCNVMSRAMERKADNIETGNLVEDDKLLLQHRQNITKAYKSAPWYQKLGLGTHPSPKSRLKKTDIKRTDIQKKLFSNKTPKEIYEMAQQAKNNT